ncbi:hypothetical protein GCM10007036_14740 [Alsobacter metallidurans]|uniref:Transglutaminase n=2 Tax=Alsobacter metallidurans TaxID=340221 RepID=A0A917MHI0_9HYPH|nr:hypothetical protein GCM10007036_14740 [Alsobacter metallidurans]
MPAENAANPIKGWVDFCRRYASECEVDVKEPDSLVLTDGHWALLRKVNARINSAIMPVTDPDHWGVADRWDFAEDGKGDCEDYQLLKRKVLAQAGIPRRTMLMTVVVDERGEGHAVLIVRTDHGDLVLDNRRDEIVPWDQTPYTYVKRESQNSVGWVSLDRRTGIDATASGK